MQDNFDLVFAKQVNPGTPDNFNLSFYALSDEAVFRASFEDASGRDPLPTALLERTPARKLAGHNVICYMHPPMICEKTIPILKLSDYRLTKPCMMIWIQDDKDPIFRMGRWAQIQGRTFGANPLELRLRVRISDHPESFIPPGVEPQE